MVGDEFGALLHIGFMVGFGAYAGDAEEILQALERFGLRGIDLLENVVEHGK